MRKALDTLSLTLATGLGVSYIPARLQPRRHWTGAGTLGALWGLVTWSLVPVSPGTQFAVILFSIIAAIYFCGRAEAVLGVKDDQKIILDEWVGYWTAAAFLPRTAGYLVAAFVLFRILDMWKGPWGRKLSLLPGGPGVVLDDIAAGLVANMTLQVFRFFLSSY